jgi:hypothetical protein
METLPSSGYKYPPFTDLLWFGITLYDYNPPESPESTCFPFEKGTLIRVESINSGWLHGRIDGKLGWVPGNFVSDVVTVNDSSSESQIILKIGDQALQKARELAVALEIQHLVVRQCANTLDLRGGGDDGSRRRLNPPTKEQVSSVNATGGIGVNKVSLLTQLSQDGSSIATLPKVDQFLRPKFENDLRYDENGELKGGTLDALIERLTGHEVMDPAFNEAFLLTFESFTSAGVFFYKLIGRYFDRTNSLM